MGGKKKQHAPPPKKGNDRNKHEQERPAKKKANKHKEINEEDFRNLDRQLLPQGLFIKRVVGDGNCLFRALADQLVENQGSHKVFREGICRYMNEHRDQFAPFVYDQSFDVYLENMRTDATWGGNLELQAASMCYNCNIVVHQLNMPKFELANHNEKAKTIHLSYHDGEHYNSVHAKTESIEKKLSISANKDTTKTNPKETLNIEIIMQSTGCDDADHIRRLMKEFNNDMDTVIDMIITEKQVGHLSFEEQIEEPVEGDDELISLCIQNITDAIGYNNFDMDVLVSTIRRCEYQVDQVIDQLLQGHFSVQHEKPASKPISQPEKEEPQRTRKQKKELEKQKKVKEDGHSSDVFLTKKERSRREKEAKEREFEREMKNKDLKKKRGQGSKEEEDTYEPHVYEDFEAPVDDVVPITQSSIRI